jgi:ATP-dependent phosphofructokinase / diphosphate-dependent phosphofructokinase
MHEAPQMLKGKLLVGQSGGPTPVINASLAGVILEAQGRMEVTGIYGMLHGIEGALKDELVDLGRESPQTLHALQYTPGSALGSCRHKITDAEYERILRVCKAHDIRHFVYIGGNDSMDTCRRISDLAGSVGYEMQVIGVPKTIDNDLAETDHCPGYGSAARFLALAVRDTGLDLESMATFEDVVILEAMGRNAGWLAAASCLAKSSDEQAPHLVYVPEVAFSEDAFLEDVTRVHTQLGRVYVVVCEGVRDAAGEFVGSARMKAARDGFGHSLNTFTTGVAAYLADRVSDTLRLRARFLRPVLIGRALSACVSEVDRREAFLVGQTAVRQLAAGATGWMITLERVSTDPYICETGVVPLDRVANAEKLLPRAFLDEAGSLPNEKFRAYALPLIGEAWQPAARLQKTPLARPD